MKTTLEIQKNETLRLFVEGSRIGIYLLVLVVGLLSYLVQPGFINWSFLGPFYLIIFFGFFLHAICLKYINNLYHKPYISFLTFFLDSIFISLLIYFSGVNQSLFLFLHLVNILLAGLVLRSSGAFSVALVTSIFFTSVSIFSPEIKVMNFFFLLVLNNIAFFSVAGLSGYLSDQLQRVGAELNKSNLNLRELNEINHLILQNIPVSMISYDQSGQIFQFNHNSTTLFGITNLNEHNIFKLLEHFNNYPEYKKFDLNIQLNGQEKSLSCFKAKLNSATLNTDFFIAMLEDLTFVRQLEYSTRQNEKLAAIGGLAAGIAHEIRNPLAGISGSIELLSQTVNNEDDRKLMKIILREISRLNNLITEFLDYSRPEVPPKDVINLAQILNEVLDSVNNIKQKREDLIIKKEIATNLNIKGFSDKLKQAFLNMIINALQAMENTQKAELSVSAYISETNVVVKIKDSGCGMSESTRLRMFEPFHTTKPKGTGLGLAVTHKILEGHKASVSVNSQEGLGTEIVLQFPLVQSEII